jgi:hypothetical protein
MDVHEKTCGHWGWQDQRMTESTTQSHGYGGTSTEARNLVICGLSGLVEGQFYDVGPLESAHGLHSLEQQLASRRDSHKLRPLTKGDAVGLSRIPISSGENCKRGITNARSGTNSRMMIGNPTAADMMGEQQTQQINIRLVQG